MSVDGRQVLRRNQHGAASAGNADDAQSAKQHGNTPQGAHQVWLEPPEKGRVQQQVPRLFECLPLLGGLSGSRKDRSAGELHLLLIL